MRCAVLQPSYIPWRGYFHQIQKADLFVFYDDVQYDKHGWRNRNLLKAPGGLRWVTIPVLTKGVRASGGMIRDVRINWARDWVHKHRLNLMALYAKAPFFDRYWPIVDDLYAPRDHFLADFTIRTTMKLAELLGIRHVRFQRSSTLEAAGSKTDRLLHILRGVGATHYVSGPAARSYLEEDKLRAAGITLEYMTYDYPTYPQFHPPFAGNVSILDLLFMTGPNAPTYIWG